MNPHHVHMIGIGGSGMSALARLYLQQGLRVTGSDEVESGALRDLRALGAQVHAGRHDAAYVGDADLVVHSSAVPADNPELVEARRRGIRTLKHAQALGALVNARRGIAVAGTHGKTTTTSMIAFALQRAGKAPSFQVGGEMIDLGTSAGWGAGEWMVIEADEFDRRFLEYYPEIAVVTNVEPDHFEYYGTVEAMTGAFAQFLTHVRPGGAIVACGEDERLAGLLEQMQHATCKVQSERVANAGIGPDGVDSRDRRVIRYGAVEGNADGGQWDWVATDVQEVPGGSRFVVRAPGLDEPIPASLQIPGRHHVRNALAAIAVCDLVGATVRETASALAEFHGARRRFEPVGEAAGVRVFSDYGHHPTEVRVNLEAARHLVTPPGRVWVVFQPHLYVRTEMLFDQFARAFDAADVVVLTDVYSPSGREPAGRYRGSAELVQAMRHSNARHVSTPEAARLALARDLRAGDVAVVMGAGPIDRLAPLVVADLEQRHGS
jgi:UDP-N-acetylmuramate--alanine ligase